MQNLRERWRTKITTKITTNITKVRSKVCDKVCDKEYVKINKQRRQTVTITRVKEKMMINSSLVFLIYNTIVTWCVIYITHMHIIINRSRRLLVQIFIGGVSFYFYLQLFVSFPFVSFSFFLFDYFYFST